jgi:basic membrane protein A
LTRAEEELGVQGDFLESNAPTDYVNNLTQLADNGSSPIFAVGFLLTDAVNEVAAQYPDTDFAIIDSVSKGPNVASLLFREQESGYLAGVVAGLMTQEDTDYTTADEQVVGFLGGQEESPPVVRFQAGYEAGVRSVCPDCEILSQYAGTTPEAFADPARGREISLQQIQGGADIIFHGAGATGEGLFDAATDERIFAIGVDSDQATLVPEAPILTSAVKRVDNAVFQTIEQSQNGEFPGGETVEFGLENGGLSLAPFGRFDDQVPQEVKDQVEQAQKDIISGEVEVPTEVQ